jgi:hypothetical protein
VAEHARGWQERDLVAEIEGVDGPVGTPMSGPGEEKADV